jgi:hypothetical protein
VTTETVAPELSTFDFMELVAFGSKVEREGFCYARDNYGPRFESEELAAVPLGEAWREYRAKVGKWWDSVGEELGCALHNAHVSEALARQNDACLWGIRYLRVNPESGRLRRRRDISFFETEECVRDVFAGMIRAALRDTVNRGYVLLRRDAPGGEWVDVETFVRDEAAAGA